MNYRPENLPKGMKVVRIADLPKAQYDELMEKFDQVFGRHAIAKEHVKNVMDSVDQVEYLFKFLRMDNDVVDDKITITMENEAVNWCHEEDEADADMKADSFLALT